MVRMKVPEKMRLQRMIALATSISRRAAEKNIEAGDVEVNGTIVTELGTSVNPFRDKVKFKGELLILKTERTYFIYNKPRNLMVTKSDPEGRPKIWDKIDPKYKKLNTVGRLDFETEGILILSDDGDFINELTHPKHEIWKTYRAWVRGKLSKDDIEKLSSGVKIDNYKTLPAKINLKQSEDNNSLVEISIREGKNRQVRKMFESIGCTVRHLKRLSVGSVKLGRLETGEIRKLRADEVAALKESCKR